MSLVVEMCVMTLLSTLSDSTVSLLLVRRQVRLHPRWVSLVSGRTVSVVMENRASSLGYNSNLKRCVDTVNQFSSDLADLT